MLHDALRSGAAKVVEYILRRYPRLISDPAVLRSKRFPAIWKPPLHYLCTFNVPEQLAKLKLLLPVCGLELDSRGWSPVHYLLANSQLSGDTKLEMLRIMKDEKGREAVQAAVCHKDGMGSSILSFCLAANYPPLFDEVLELLERPCLEDCADPVRTAIVLQNSEALGKLQDKGASLIRGDAADSLFLGVFSSNAEIRVKVLAWARARHIAYFLQVLLPALEADMSADPPFSFTVLRKSLTMQIDLDVLRVLVAIARRLEEVPNVLAEVLKTTQPAGVLFELILGTSLVAIRRSRVEMLASLLALGKVKECLDAALKGKQLKVKVNPSQRLSDAMLSALADLQSCGVQFTHLEEKRRDTECLKLWKRGLFAFDMREMAVAVRLIKSFPEDFLPLAIAFFKKTKKLDVASSEALLLTVRTAFKAGDSASASQLLLEWMKAPLALEGEGLHFREGMDLLECIAFACSLRLGPELRLSVLAGFRTRIKSVVMKAVPKILSIEQWKPWEKYIVSRCEKNEDAACELLKEAPLELFGSLYAALSSELKFDRRFSFGLFALRSLCHAKSVSDRLVLMKQVFESVAGMHHRGPLDDSDRNAEWVRILAAVLPLQDLLSVSGLDDIDFDRIVETATEENLIYLSKSLIQAGEFTVKTPQLMRTIRRRSLWALLKELFAAELRNEALQKVVQEEYLLYLVNSQNLAELGAVLPQCVKLLQINSIALAASREALELIVTFLNQYSCSYSFKTPTFVPELAGKNVHEKFLESTKRQELAFLTPRLLPLVSSFEDTLVAGLRNLLRHGRSEDFAATVNKLQSSQNHFEMWEVIRTAALNRTELSTTVLANMARALMEASANTNLHIRVFCGAFQTGLLEVPRATLPLVLRRPWTAEEIDHIIQQSAQGQARIRKTQNLAEFKSLLLSSFSQITSQGSGLFSSEASTDFLESISVTDSVELVQALQPLLQAEATVWQSLCMTEIQRGHAAHLRILLRCTPPQADMLDLACKSSNASDLIRSLLKAKVAVSESAQQYVLERGKLDLIALVVPGMLSEQQAASLLLSNSSTALEAYRTQLLPFVPALMPKLCASLIKRKKFVSLSFLLNATEDRSAAAKALLENGDERNILFCIIGFAPAACIARVKWAINDKKLWHRMLQERDADGLTPVHNLLGAHISDLAFGSFESVSIRQFGFDNIFCIGAFATHPLLGRLSDLFRHSYQLQFEARATQSQHARPKPLREGPVYLLMAHLLTLKATGEAGRNFLVGKEQKFLAVHDSVCRLQFLVALGYPLSEKTLLREAVKHGSEAPALFLLTTFFHVNSSEKALVSFYRRSQVVLPKQFLRLVSKTFGVGRPQKAEFARDFAAELAMLSAHHQMPHFMFFLGRTYPEVYLAEPPLLMQLPATNQHALFVIMAEHFFSQKRMSPVELSHMLDQQADQLAAHLRISIAALQLELMRRELLPAGMLYGVLDLLGAHRAQSDLDLDSKADKFIDDLYLGICRAEALRVEVKALKVELCCVTAESPAQLPFSQFAEYFRHYQLATARFSMQVESSLWDIIQSKTKPWAPLYLAAQLCGSSGLLGLFLQHSTSELHFLISPSPPITKPAGKGFQVKVKPSWLLDATEPYSVRLNLTYSVPCVYSVNELQDSLRHFSVSLNSSTGVTIKSISVESLLEMEDYEVLRAHVLQDSPEDVCGVKTLELSLQQLLTAEDEYFHLSQPSFRLDADDVQVICSSSVQHEQNMRRGVQALCARLNRELNPTLKLECALEIKCVPYQLYSHTPGFRVTVTPDRNVLWDFSGLPEFRHLKVRNAFHSARLFESKIAQYTHITVDSEALVDMFAPHSSDPKFCKYVCEAAKELLPLQLWYELEQYGMFFSDIQGIFVSPEAVGTGAVTEVGQLQFSRFASTLIVHVPLLVSRELTAVDSWRRAASPPGTLGLKALAVWTPPDVWQSTVVVSHLLASEDIDRDKQTYEWVDLHEYIEQQLRSINRFLSDFAKFQVQSELDKERVREVLEELYPGLWAPSVTELTPLFRDWTASTSFLAQVRTAISDFQQDFGIQSTDNLLQLGEQQLHALAGLGEVADDKNNIVLYRLALTRGKVRMEMNYFTFEVEQVPYALGQLRRDPSQIEEQLTRSFQTFGKEFMSKHGAQLNVAVELSQALRTIFASAPEVQYQLALGAIHIFASEVKTALIRIVTFSDMSQHLVSPLVTMQNQPISPTVAVATALSSRLLRLVVDTEDKQPLYLEADKALSAGLGCDSTVLTKVLISMLSEHFRQNDPETEGNANDICALALLASRRLLTARQSVASRALRVSAGQLRLHLGAGQTFIAKVRSGLLDIIAASQHQLKCFLPQVSDIVFGVLGERAWRRLRVFASSPTLRTTLAETFQGTELQETEADLRRFARPIASMRFRHLDSWPIPDLNTMFPLWVSAVKTKVRVLPSQRETPPVRNDPLFTETVDRSERRTDEIPAMRKNGSDDMEVEFKNIEAMQYDPHEGKDDEPLLSERVFAIEEPLKPSLRQIRLEPLGEPRRSSKVVPSLQPLQPLHEEQKDLRPIPDVFKAPQATPVVTSPTPLPCILPQKPTLRDYPTLHPKMCDSLRQAFESCSNGSQHLKIVLPSEDLPHLAYLLNAAPAMIALSVEVMGEVTRDFPLLGDTNLTDLSVSQQQLSSIWLAQTLVRRSPHLRNLVLDNCGLGDTAWEELAKTVAEVRDLQLLSLQNNGLTEGSTAALTEVLERCPRVAINLQSNRIRQGLRPYRDRVDFGKVGCGCCALM